MDLSIIIPVYNTEIDIVKRCINSVIKDLNRIKYEIWIIDDGSEVYKSRGYCKLIEELKNLDVHYIYKENSGVSSARNLGIKNAMGKYIMFLDSDDILYSGKMLYEDFRIDADIVFYNKMYIKEDGNKYERKEIEKESGYVDCNYILKDFIVRNRFYSPVAKIIKRSFLIQNGIFFDEGLIQGEDAVFNLEMLLHSPKIYYINKAIYEYNFDFKTSLNRWKKYPDIMFDNFFYLYMRKIEIIEKMDKDKKKEYLKGLNEKSVNYLFQVCMDFYKDADYLKKALLYMEKMKMGSLDVNFKTKVQYKTVRKQRMLVIRALAIIRSFYLKYLKKSWK